MLKVLKQLFTLTQPLSHVLEVFQSPEKPQKVLLFRNSLKLKMFSAVWFWQEKSHELFQTAPDQCNKRGFEQLS